MQTKTDDYCSQCGHKDTCKEVYGRLGEYQGPSVLGEVTLAFLIPIAGFISSSAAIQWLLRGTLEGKLLTAVSAGAGFGVTLAIIAGTRLLRHRFSKKHCDIR